MKTKTIDEAINAGTKAIDLYELGNDDVISRGALREWLQAAARVILEAAARAAADEDDFGNDPRNEMAERIAKKIRAMKDER